MNFGYRDNCLFFHCAGEGRKLDIVRKNPRVCFEMDIDYELVKKDGRTCGWSTSYRSVIGNGIAMILDHHDEKSAALNIITGHYGAVHHKYSEKELENTTVFKIQIENITAKQAGNAGIA